ncbi:DUF1810 domain-containing protein [Aliikangiella marina]|uniref:DUF1810 domain-containing protein n=1 Tax=Aliikangiella marina TaxID=1712262 RepID=A0A545TJ86_9GAMM|nr:DUF1810 domain-containing protein [Aliikangiella marina]TQV77278.1 DUF1810 domain-containing protein [Aliikangiella marina]
MKSSNKDYNLERFKIAQDKCYHKVKAELSTERKLTHWMWYIFPQVYGLGQSATAQFYSIKSLPEANAYWRDPLLAGRLKECCQLLIDARETNITKIMGSPDDLKLCSSMTLFDHVIDNNSVFKLVLEKYYNASADPLTLEKIASWNAASE